MSKGKQTVIQGQCLENEYNFFLFQVVVTHSNGKVETFSDPKARRFMHREDAIKAMKHYVDEFTKQIKHQLRSSRPRFNPKFGR